MGEYNKGRNRLTIKTVAALGPGKHHDGGGLYLTIDVYGKRWTLRATFNGKRREIGLGSYGLTADTVSLARARELAEDARAKARAGTDPITEREMRRAKVSAPPVPTFAEAAHTVHALRRQEWSNGKHQAQWISTLATFAFPVIGDKPVDRIDTDDVLRVLSPIWSLKPETARRVKQRIGVVLDWARAMRYRSGDAPTHLLGDALPKHRGRPVHHAALPHSEVAGFVTALRASKAEPESKLAFEYLILTCVRTIEVRGALWSELDLATKLWTIPPARMKARRPHVVPLSRAALACLEAVSGPREGLVFRDRATLAGLSENRLLNCRDAIGYEDRCTPHGFRSSFRDWAAEQSGVSFEVAEACLAHRIKDKTVAAYMRTDFLERRRELMRLWADYVAPNLANRKVGA